MKIPLLLCLSLFPIGCSKKPEPGAKLQLLVAEETAREIDCGRIKEVLLEKVDKEAIKLEKVEVLDKKSPEAAVTPTGDVFHRLVFNYADASGNAWEGNFFCSQALPEKTKLLALKSLGTLDVMLVDLAHRRQNHTWPADQERLVVVEAVIVGEK